MNRFREWVSDNLRYIMLGLAILLAIVIIVFAVRIVRSSRGGDSSSRNEAVETEGRLSEEDETESETEEALAEGDAALLEIVRQYYTAMGDKDMDTLEDIVESMSDTDREKIESSIIESYNNIAVYSLSGPVEDSYVVYAYYEAKLADIDDLVPSLACLYVKTDKKGNLYIADQQADETAEAYIEEMKQNTQVQDLILEVNDKYQDVVSANEELREILDEMGEPETEITIPDAEDAEVEVNKIVETTDILNIRADSTADSELLGVLNLGVQVTRLEVLDNGWAKIQYGDITGYVLNEYLTEVTDSE